MVAYDYSNGKESRNQQATVWVGGLEPQCTEELLWELMVQAGPVGIIHFSSLILRMSSLAQDAQRSNRRRSIVIPLISLIFSSECEYAEG